MIALCAQFGVSIIDQGVPTLAGFLKADFGLSASTAGIMVAAFPFGKILGSYTAGRATDRVGERPILLAGGLAAGVCALLASLSPLPFVLFFLVLGGAAASSATPAGGKLVLNSFTPDRRGFVLGVRQIAVPAAGVLAAVLLPPLAASASWRVSLAVAAGAAVVGLIPLAAVRVGSEGADLILHPERRPERTVNRNVLLLTVWGALVITGQWAVATFLVLDFHEAAGMTLPTAALLLAVANGSGAFGRAGWGWLSDRFVRVGRKPLLLLVNLFAIAGTTALLATPRSAPTAVLALVAGLAGISLIGFQGLWVTMVAEAADPSRIGAATGFAATFTTAAVTISPPLFGLVADVTNTYRAIWGVLDVLVVLAVIPALLLGELTPFGPHRRTNSRADQASELDTGSVRRL